MSDNSVVSPYDPGSDYEPREFAMIVTKPEEKELEKKVFELKQLRCFGPLTGRLPVGGQYMQWYTNQQFVKEYHTLLVQKMTEWQNAVRKDHGLRKGSAGFLSGKRRGSPRTWQGTPS